MKITDIPTKFSIPFANSAALGFIRDIPTDSQIGITPGAASLTDGFPPVTFEQITAGGTPPWGADMNGIENWITRWLRWAAAGGFPVFYDATFQTAISGYPLGAVLMASDFSVVGRMWISTVDDNMSDPDTAGANWIAFPDKAVQLQKPNYASDIGAVNQVVISLSPVPTSWAEIVGAPVRVAVANANTVNNPTITINALAPATIVNGDNSALGIGQLVASGIMEGIPRADGKFQLNYPAKSFTPASTWPVPGVVMPWPTETVPSGFLECNGAAVAISSYPNLYGVLGTRYGGDGVSTFALPDYRGRFLRGWDHGVGRDPNAATRLNSGGGYTGDHVGTIQPSASGYVRLSGPFDMSGPVSIAASNIPVTLNGSDSGLLPGTGEYVTNAIGVLWNGYPGTSPFGGGWSPLATSYSTNSFYNLSPGGTFAPRVYTDAIYAIRGNLDMPALSGTAALSGTLNFTTTTGSSETRPINIYVMWVIAY